MAAIEKGTEAHAKSEHSRRCEGINKEGQQCRAWSKSDSEYCWFHSMSPAERLAAARRGGLTTAAKRRAAKSGSPRSGLRPHVSLEEVLSVCTQGLSATFSDAGLPTEIDWTTRLLSLVVLMNVFPRQYRAAPDEAAALIRRVLPEKMQPATTEAETQKLIQRSYTEARKAWRQERGQAAGLRRLYTEDAYPKGLVAPWEDAAALDKALAVYMRERAAAEVEVLPSVAV